MGQVYVIMSHEVLIAISLVGLYLVFVILLWIHKRRHLHTIFKRYNIPGPKPNFLDGNMDELKAAPTPNDVITRWIKEYGPVFGYFIGETPYLIVKDEEMLKQVMIKNFSLFTDRPEMYMEMKPICDSLVAIQGQRWKGVRSILTPTYSASKMKLMAKSMNEKVAVTLQVVAEASERGEMFDIYQNLQALTLDVIADSAFAMKVNCQRDLKDPLLIAVYKLLRFSHSKALDLAIKFPFIASIFLFLNRFFTVGQMIPIVVKNVSKQIKRRRANPNAGKVDLLQLMLEANNPDYNQKSGKKHQVRLTDDDLVANSVLTLLAGYESTSTTLAFTFWLLIQHQDVQEKLYHEIMTSCTDEDLSYDCVMSLQYMDQVINESLRMYPPVTGFISRKCAEECQVSDYTIPKDVIVLAPIWDIHHDPELWPEPYEFDPDRFSKENKSFIRSLSFMPFGVGPRNCIGMRFAMLEVKLALAHLLRKFKFVACEKTENPLTLSCPMVLINPANGIYTKALAR